MSDHNRYYSSEYFVSAVEPPPHVMAGCDVLSHITAPDFRLVCKKSTTRVSCQELCADYLAAIERFAKFGGPVPSCKYNSGSKQCNRFHPRLNSKHVQYWIGQAQQYFAGNTLAVCCLHQLCSGYCQLHCESGRCQWSHHDVGTESAQRFSEWVTDNFDGFQCLPKLENAKCTQPRRVVRPTPNTSPTFQRQCTLKANMALLKPYLYNTVPLQDVCEPLTAIADAFNSASSTFVQVAMFIEQHTQEQNCDKDRVVTILTKIATNTAATEQHAFDAMVHCVTRLAAHTSMVSHLMAGAYAATVEALCDYLINVNQSCVQNVVLEIFAHVSNLDISKDMSALLHFGWLWKRIVSEEIHQSLSCNPLFCIVSKKLCQ